jgi:hypothetical protein
MKLGGEQCAVREMWELVEIEKQSVNIKYTDSKCMDYCLYRSK